MGLDKGDIDEAFKLLEDESGVPIDPWFRDLLLKFRCSEDGNDLDDPEISVDELAALMMRDVLLLFEYQRLSDQHRSKSLPGIAPTESSNDTMTRDYYPSSLTKQVELLSFIAARIPLTLANHIDRDFSIEHRISWKQIAAEWNAENPQRPMKPESLRVTYNNYIKQDRIKEAFFEKAHKEFLVQVLTYLRGAASDRNHPINKILRCLDNLGRGFAAASQAMYRKINSPEFQAEFKAFTNQAQSAYELLTDMEETRSKMAAREGISREDVLALAVIDGIEEIKDFIEWATHRKVTKEDLEKLQTERNGG